MLLTIANGNSIDVRLGVNIIWVRLGGDIVYVRLGDDTIGVRLSGIDVHVLGGACLS